MTIDANLLRQLAEAAEGLRNQNLVLVNRGNVPMLVASADVLGTDTELISLRTDDAVTRDQRPTFEVALQVAGAPDVGVSADSDSIFWTLSGVQKFLIPYYARVWSSQTMHAFQSKIASDTSWVAVRHSPSSSVTVDCQSAAQGAQSLTVEQYVAV